MEVHRHHLGERCSKESKTAGSDSVAAIKDMSTLSVK